jgi:tetratricopeptide (TPR) repeat protein
MRRIIAAVLFLVPVAAPAAAQDSVRSLHARVTQIQDTLELRRIERTHETGAAPEDQLAAGFAALQMWEVTGVRTHADRSRRHFDRAASRDPRNAWAHYGHALSLEPRIRDQNDGFFVAEDALARGLGYDAVSRARRALERAVQLDPSLPGATELLGEYAVATRDGSALIVARNTFANAAAAPDAPLHALLGLARTAREQGDYLGAASAADRAVRFHDAPEAHFELARAFASVPGNAQKSGAAYFAALRGGSEDLLDAMWVDAELIARDIEERRWEKAVTPAEKRAVLSSFWQIRGALGGGTPEERVAEHYSRLNHAWITYRRWGRAGAPPLNALRLHRIDPRFSDAGVIYIRHGRPDSEWTLGLGRMSWFYRNEQGKPLSFHFMTSDDAGWAKDAILMHKVGCLLDVDLVLRDPRLRPLTHGCSRNSVEAVSAQLRRDAERALRTDTDYPNFATAIPFFYDIYMFRGDAGETEVVAGFGVPFATLPQIRGQLRVSFAVVDTAMYLASRAGGLVDAGALRQSGDALLRTNASVSAAPTRRGAYRVDVRNNTSSMGMTYGGPLVVYDFAGTALRLSDIVIAEPHADGTFIRGPHRLSLSPTQVFPGGEFKVYYEIYNMEPRGTYETEITIERADRGMASRLLGRGDFTRLQFSDVAPEDTHVIRELRDVTAPFEPGTWLMRIKVSGSGQSGTFVRERRFTIPES